MDVFDAQRFRRNPVGKTHVQRADGPQALHGIPLKFILTPPGAPSHVAADKAHIDLPVPQALHVGGRAAGRAGVNFQIRGVLIQYLSHGPTHRVHGTAAVGGTDGQDTNLRRRFLLRCQPAARQQADRCQQTRQNQLSQPKAPPVTNTFFHRHTLSPTPAVLNFT
ncbi:hypothetical protein SDC9_130029 [bioreactor metagenome]|uniref:Uncharacterized protein n=1 Tax=bioreactor metagenome TaxID=1076179 RepID=A0A645D195_9ZZZZ